MSTTLQQTPQQTKAARRSGRKNKNADPLVGLHPNGIASERDLSSAQSESVDENTKATRRRSQLNPGSAKKPHIPSGNTSDVVSDRVRATPTKATPVKPAAYAGATFTNSPAASALPMPSFYSKSVPNVSHLPPPANGASDQQEEGKRPGPAPLQDVSPSNQAPTPLDFLFNAARQAKANPRGHSPGANSSHLSLGANTPTSNSPAPREPESVFPFELDGASTPGEESDSFSTPSYHDRMAAFRHNRSASNSVSVRDQMSEAERQEKTAALKKLLIKENLASSSESLDVNNPFNARAPQPRLYPNSSNSPDRHRSNPSTPGAHGPIPSQQNGQFSFFPAPQYHQYALNHNLRQASSLRHHIVAATDPDPTEVSADSGVASPPRISTTRTSSQPVISAGSGPSQTPGHRAKPSIAQMEEQMRTFLKLDVASKG
ncbi:hypothetical protein DV735_g2067, partial [Chaetothyriales sp. CBS 134920]